MRLLFNSAENHQFFGTVEHFLIFVTVVLRHCCTAPKIRAHKEYNFEYWLSNVVLLNLDFSDCTYGILKFSTLGVG